MNVSKRRAAIPLAVLTVLALLLGSRIAEAGSYRVYSCKTPVGQSAPTDGWTASSIAPFASPSNGCAAGGALALALNPSVDNPATASIMTWRWDAPAGTTIVAYRVWRTVRLTSAYEPNATPVAFVARPVNQLSGAYVPDGCRAAPEGCMGLGGSPGIHGGNLIAENLEGMPEVNRWHISIDCGGVAGYRCVARAPGQLMAEAYVYAAEFTLRDPDGPTIGSTSGRLTTATTHAGTELISFTASDAVSGVYRALLEVDGRIVRASVVNDNDGRCADAGVDPNTPYEFMYREPCRKNVQYEMALDTRTLSDGTHNVRVLVEDASGNRATVWSSPDFVVRNAADGGPGGPGAGGGSGAAGAGSGATPGVAPCVADGGITARFTRNDATRLTVKHGQAFGLRGRAPANADIDIFHVRGSKTTPLGSFRASGAGTFVERARARHGSGTIYLCGPGIATRLTLRVKAKVSLKVRISNWGLVRYSGRVSTGRIPKGGKIIAVQGKAGPSWQTFALRRTDSKGRFKGRYRLRVVRPGAKLRFRVRVPSEAGYPFVGVVSKSVTKRVR